MIIDYKITGFCNESCSFCWDFCKNIPPEAPDKIKKTLELIKKCGTTAISLTGGEPLCYNHIDTILTYAAEVGLKIYLSTNGYLLKNHIETISKTVSLIGLPLDSHDDSINMGRKYGMVTQTCKNIELLREKNSNIKIKIGTVLSQKNIAFIYEIGSLLFSLPNPPDSWRVYQFTPMGNAVSNLAEFQISDACFKAIREELHKKFGDKVSCLASADVNNSYVFITPQLDLCLIENTMATSICNLSTANDNELTRIFELFNIKELHSLTNRKHLAHSIFNLQPNFVTNVI